MATSTEQAAATERLRRALQGFQAAQALLLAAHRQAKALASPADMQQFWATQGGRVEARLRGAAQEADRAFKAFSAAGLVAAAGDRHLVTEARRHLADDP